MQNKKINREYIYLGYTLLIAIIYYIFSTFSKGFYQHDEAAHFLNMQKFWISPSTILGTWAKPGFKIAYVLPALLGSKAVLITNIFFASFTAYLTGKIIEFYGLRYRILGMTIAGFAPMLYQISFRNYSEMLTGFVISLLILSFLKKKYFITALLASYVFTLRQEMVLISAGLGIFFLYKKQFIPILGLFVAPIILNTFGWISTGNPNFLIDQLTGGGLDNYQQLGFFHLWNMFTPSIGVISTTLILIGVFGFTEKGKLKEYFKNYRILFIVFFPVFLFMCLVTEPSFTFFKLGANLRQLVPFSAVYGVFGVIGFYNLVEKKNNIANYIIIGFMGILLFTIFKYEYNHVAYTNVEDSTKPFLFLLGIIGTLTLIHFSKIDAKKISIIVSLLIVGHTIQQEKPYKLNPEEISVKKAVKFYKRNKMDKAPLSYVNHQMFHYFIKNTATERKEGFIHGRFDEKQLAELPKESIIVWDSHYTYRQNTKGKKGIPIQFFQKNPDYKLLFQDMASNKRFYIAILKKIN